MFNSLFKQNLARHKSGHMDTDASSMESPVTSSGLLSWSPLFIPYAPVHWVWERPPEVVFLGGFLDDSDAEPGMDTAAPGLSRALDWMLH